MGRYRISTTNSIDSLGLLRKDVARAIGTHATNVAYWVNGQTTPGLRFWPGVIRFLGYDPRPEAQTIGQALKRHREGQGLSQKQFGAQLEVDPSTLARWERDERIPAGDLRDRVQAILSPPI